MALAFSFDQIKLSKNENFNNSVLNRPLARIYTMLQDLSESIALPSSNYAETTYLADIYDQNSNKHFREWHTISKIYDIIQKPNLTDLPDVSKTLPITGQTIVWNQASGKFEFAKIPVKITDLNKFNLVDDNPVDNSVLTWNAALNSWVAQTVTKYIGVGYIYHQICSRPTVIKLPVSGAALSGGEQIVITKLKPENAAIEERYPVLITVPDESATIIGRRSIMTNNEDEDWASIHLRAVLGPDGKFMWVPVSQTGTWRPTNKIDLDNTDSANMPIDRPPALTENQIKLQPYNIDIAFNIDGEDISKEFEIVLTRPTNNSDWQLDNGTSDYVYYSPVSGIITINHNILNGMRLVRTTSYFYNNDKICQITPNEVYFDAGQSSKYGAVNIDLHEWLDLATENTIKFKILVSI